MKAKKTEAARVATKLAVPQKPPLWPLFAAIAGALIAVLWAYGPSMHGPFLFDDTTLQFALPGFAEPLRAWVGQLRPLLMFSYWVNVQISGSDPFSYHVVNVLIHLSAAILIFFIVRRLMEWGGVEPGCARRWRASALCCSFCIQWKRKRWLILLGDRNP